MTPTKSSGMAEILKDLREFRTETSPSFGALKTELNELRAEFTSIKKKNGGS
uniref:Uncharacterized protein n=1 Tax=Nothobranchius pienaari TaxID=704102 RepID=A0A1A8MSJ6_9TELE